MKTRRDSSYEANRGGRAITLVLAGLVGMLLLAAILGLVVAVLGPVMASAVVAFVGGLCVLVLFHYITWGWWLGNVIRRDVEADEAWQADQATHGEATERDAAD